jgi:hypothetical protein
MTGKGKNMLRISAFYKNMVVLSESVTRFIADATGLENKDRRLKN